MKPSFFIARHCLLAHSTDKCEALPIFHFIYFSGAHICEEHPAFDREVGGEVILAGCYEDGPSWYTFLQELFEDLGVLVGVECYGPEDVAIGGVDNRDMQTSERLAFIPFALYRDPVYRYFGEIAGVKPRRSRLDQNGFTGRQVCENGTHIIFGRCFWCD